MLTFRAGELSQWVSRFWKNGIPAGKITGISHDTRTLAPGDLYVALRGAEFDGHAFLQHAFDQGAVGALVEEYCAWERHPILCVPDTLRGLQDMARGYRRKWMGTVVGITGSVGKTTVKEMCADVLAWGGTTHRTAGNYNNHIGVPLTMLRMPQDARYGVFEIGMSHAGEIGPLTQLLQPKIGIMTDIGNAHRENFDSLEQIAREKARLIEGVPSSGMVLLDRDSPWYPLMRRHTCANVVTLSVGGVGDYVGRAVEARVMHVNGFNYSMPLPGEHIMRNALRAIALGLELGSTPAEISDGLRQFKLPPMRWEKSEINGIQFINDAYNASPLSMQANLRTFAALPVTGKKWVVLGGMRELGAISEEEHAALGRCIDTLGLDGVIAVGELGKQVVCKGAQPFFHTLDPAEAAQILSDHLEAGDQVLLKASRGERLEQILNYFKEI